MNLWHHHSFWENEPATKPNSSRHWKPAAQQQCGRRCGQSRRHEKKWSKSGSCHFSEVLELLNPDSHRGKRGQEKPSMSSSSKGPESNMHFSTQVTVVLEKVEMR